MSTVLDAVTLPDGMVWEDRYKWSPVAQTVVRTLGGNTVVYSQALQTGTPITLRALDDQGWLTKEQVDALRVLAAVSGATYTLTIGSDSYTVVFRHQDAPAVEMVPIIPRGIQVAGDYFVGSIKLMTV